MFHCSVRPSAQQGREGSLTLATCLAATGNLFVSDKFFFWSIFFQCLRTSFLLVLSLFFKQTTLVGELCYLRRQDIICYLGEALSASIIITQ